MDKNIKMNSYFVSFFYQNKKGNTGVGNEELVATRVNTTVIREFCEDIKRERRYQSCVPIFWTKNEIPPKMNNKKVGANSTKSLTIA